MIDVSWYTCDNELFEVCGGALFVGSHTLIETGFLSLDGQVGLGPIFDNDWNVTRLGHNLPQVGIRTTAHTRAGLPVPHDVR